MIQAIVELSRRMLSHAEKDEWEQVDELQVERQRMIEQTFPLNLGATEVGPADDAARRIREILDLDKQLMQLALVQQQEIGKTLGKLNQGRVATRAYQDTSRE